MGSKRKHRSRERSRSRDRLKVKRERRSRSRSSESRRRRRSPSPGSVSSLKNLAGRHQQPNYSQPIEDFDREYFFRMSKRIQEDFKEEVDKELFAQNLYHHINNREVGLSFHKTVSICIQWLIENATGPEEIKGLTERICIRKYSLEFVNNQFSSHVIQAIVEASLKVLSRECTLEAFEQRHFKWSLNYILDVAEFLIVHIDQILNDLNGFHVASTVMEALAGIRVGRLHKNRKAMGFGQKTNINTEIEKDIVIKELPSPLKSKLKKLAKAIVDRDDSELREMINGKATSIIQYLLFILKLRSSELCQQLVKKMIDLIFCNQEDKVSVISNANCAYLVETLILVSNEHRLKRIWEKHFKGSLRAMWSHDVANFIVQRLLDSLTSEELYQDVSFEILPHLASIFLLNRPGIGVCLAKATLRFTHFQQEFIYAIMKAFYCLEPKEKQIQLVPLMLFSDNTIITPTPNPNSLKEDKNSAQIWLHGSLMLQYMFQYKETYRLWKSLLSIDTRELVGVINDASGSHAIDAFLKSPTVPDKAKEQFVDKLGGYFVDLACNKYGSRVIDNILSSVSINVKMQIMDEFANKEALLLNNKNGYFLSKNVGLFHYKHRHDEWREIEREKERKKKTFSDLLDDPKANDHHRYDNGGPSYRHAVSAGFEPHGSHHPSSHGGRAREAHDNGHPFPFKRPRSSFKPSPSSYKSIKY